MSTKSLNNRQSIAYIAMRQFVLSGLFFLAFIVLFVSAVTTYYLLFGNTVYHPLGVGGFDWNELFATLGPALIIGAGLFAATSTPMALYTQELSFKQKGIKYRRGLLRTKESFVPYGNVKTMTFDQSILGKIFHAGSVSIDYGSLYDLNLPFVSEKKAELLQRKILNLTKSA